MAANQLSVIGENESVMAKSAGEESAAKAKA
jgi:hypothetical protein